MKPLSRRTVGEYSLERPLGYGGMAEVWLGRHRVNDSLAAIKLLRPGMDAGIRRRFELEQRVVARLSHPHIVPVFDLAESYIAFAYIEGVNLRQRIRAPLDASQAITIVNAIGTALAAAHAQDVVHCDVKPANILLDEQGTPFLTDFGIARLLADNTTDGGRTVAGTPDFMAPEQRVGIALPASDQYGLARTLLALLLQEAPPRYNEVAIDRLAPDLRARLAPILERALAEYPSERYPSVLEFVAALRDVEIAPGPVTPQLARPLRDTRHFSWAQAPSHRTLIGEHLGCARYRLSELEAAGEIDAAASVLFKQASGYADIAWDVYGHQARLGPLDNSLALARATEVVVLLHGLWTSSALWRDMAIGVARDNGAALVLVPDLAGFGDSRLRDERDAWTCTPRGIMLAVRAWLELIGVQGLPTVLVGHSYSATALLCAEDHELGRKIHRLCISPVLIFNDPAGRWKSMCMAALAQLSRLLPDAWRARLARHMFRRDAVLARIRLDARLAMAAAAHRVGGRRVAQFFWGMYRARPAPAEDLVRCTVVTTPDDPLVTPADAARAIALCGIVPEQHFKLLYGGHFPQFMDDEHPEWGARNIHELVNLIDSITGMPEDILGRRTPELLDGETTLDASPSTEIGTESSGR